MTEKKEKLRQDMNTSLGFPNQFLEGPKWGAGENPTIADTAIMATLSTILEIDWDISQFPNIQRWYKDCSILPGYKENLEGAKAFAALVKNNLK